MNASSLVAGPLKLQIRPFRLGDAAALRAVFHASVHGLACAHYSAAQLHAWAPRDHDAAEWAERLRRNRPFIAEIGSVVAGYADLQDSGCIDQFFVAPAHARRGVATALMAHLHASAADRGIGRLCADVSRSAEAFFCRSGFAVEARQRVALRGAVLANARMAKSLAARHP